MSFDAAGVVHDTATHLLDVQRKTNQFVKNTWKSPPSPSEIHVAAVAIANYVDAAVDRIIPGEVDAGPSTTLSEETHASVELVTLTTSFLAVRRLRSQILPAKLPARYRFA